MGLVRLATKRRGFTLTEIAIVLGTVGVLMSAIWMAQSSASEKRKENDAVIELQAIAQGMSNTFQGRVPSYGGDITANTIAMGGIIPAQYAVAGAVTTPWGGNVTVTISANPLTWIGTANVSAGYVYRITFNNIGYAGCVALLLNGTSCQSRQANCPIVVYTKASSQHCSANQNNCCTSGACSNVPTFNATDIGWKNMTTQTAQTMCNANIGAGASATVKFDYSTQ